MWPNLQKGVLYTRPIVQLWRGITSFASKLLNWNFQYYKYNDRRVLLPNFKAVGPTQTELHPLKAETSGACINGVYMDTFKPS